MKKIHDGTLRLADSLHLMIAPVGWAWQTVVHERPATVLFAADKAHPALPGSYLGAAVFYVTLFQEAATGINYYGGLSDSEAAYLQQIATSTVLNDLEKWHILEP